MNKAVQNNNPLNLRSSLLNLWKGELPSDNDFEKFETWILGLRAGLKNMKHLISDGNNTIQKLVSTWAPPTENDTEGYIRYVSQDSGIERNRIISFCPDDICPIAIAMVKMESGVVIDNLQVLQAIALI
jgi:hypothetical protein